MKKINICLALFIGIFVAIACNPIEDKSLIEDNYDNVGDPISKEELQTLISITQPIANEDGKVEGDQYVVLNNSRPEIPGVWHIQTNTGERTIATNHDTIVYAANGTYSIYFVARSAFETVPTDPVEVKVTNCFDEWDNFFTGAKDKSDSGAKKVWEYWEGPTGLVYYNGMYSNWKHFAIDDIHTGKNAWEAVTTKAVAGDYTMVFEYEGSKLTIYNPDGSVNRQGGFAYTHEVPDAGVLGELKTTVPIAGSEKSWTAVGGNNTFWLIQFDDTHMVVAHPVADWAVGDFWNHSAWYSFYKVRE